MSQTAVFEQIQESFDSLSGEVTQTTTSRVHKSHIEVTDEFFKVSKYLNTIFAYNNIPLSLVPISLLFAQRMQFKTNSLYLLKSDKEEIAEMLSIKMARVEQMIRDCKQFDIIRPTGTRGKYEVNGFLFSTGSLAETRKLQAHFNFDDGSVIAQAEQKNLITGETVRKSVIDAERKSKRSLQCEGQLRLEDFDNG